MESTEQAGTFPSISVFSTPPAQPTCHPLVQSSSAVCFQLTQSLGPRMRFTVICDRSIFRTCPLNYETKQVSCFQDTGMVINGLCDQIYNSHI